MDAARLIELIKDVEAGDQIYRMAAEAVIKLANHGSALSYNYAVACQSTAKAQLANYIIENQKEILAALVKQANQDYPKFGNGG